MVRLLPLTLEFSSLLEDRGLLDYPNVRKVPYKYLPKNFTITKIAYAQTNRKYKT